MKNEIKTVSLIGLGAIGGFLASHMLPVLGGNLRIVAGGERRKKLEQEGLIVNGTQMFFSVVSPQDPVPCADLAIIIPKMTGLAQALQDIKAHIGPDTILITPLNGVESEETAASYYGWERILYSIARVSVQKKENRISYSDATAYFELGERGGGTSPRLEAVCRLFEKAKIRPVVPEDIQKAMWEKFVCNVSENQVSAVLGLPFCAWGRSDHANTLRLKAAAEVIAIARAKGIRIEEDYAKKHIERLNILPPQNKPSTLQDIENGRKTEVELFAGTVMRLGKETGVPTPVNEFLYHAIRVLEEKNDGLFQ